MRWWSTCEGGHHSLPYTWWIHHLPWHRTIPNSCLEQDNCIHPAPHSCQGNTCKVKVKVVQCTVNSNITTIGHKLQGVSLNQMVVRSWNYSTPNWIYIVLSRVRTLKGLYICQKLKYTQVTKLIKLLKEKEHLRGNKQELIKYLNS